jgi:hypothetical protein
MTAWPEPCFAVVSQTAATGRESRGTAGRRYAAPPTESAQATGRFRR